MTASGNFSAARSLSAASNSASPPFRAYFSLSIYPRAASTNGRANSSGRSILISVFLSVIIPTTNSHVFWASSYRPSLACSRPNSSAASAVPASL